MLSLSLSHTHSGCASLIWHDINTLSVAVYTELHSHAKTTCIFATVISTVSVRVAVTCRPAPLAIKASARNRQGGHARNRPIPITGRSIGASLLVAVNIKLQKSI